MKNISNNSEMEAGSVLNFTYENSINGEIPFLDVCIKAQNGQLESDVSRKQTNYAKLLNAKSERPGSYKTRVIINGIHRAHKICSTRELFNQEMKIFKHIS